MSSFTNMLVSMAERDPRVAGNPVAQNSLNVLKNGTMEQKRQLFDNICRTYGMTEQEAAQDAASFMRSMFGL